MRFLLTGSKSDFIMIGEPVVIPAAPDELFVVHPNVFKDMTKLPYSVTHADSGFRAGAGTTIEQAIHDAVNNCAMAAPGGLAAAIAMANDLRASVRASFQ